MKASVKLIIAFGLGLVTFALAAVVFNVFVMTPRPEKNGSIEDWGEICVYQDVDGINLTVSPKGCFSSSCTQIKQQVGKAVIDLQNQEIKLDARFFLLKSSRFPLPCSENCEGGGRIHFVLSNLNPNDYTLWFGAQKVGGVSIFSGRPTPRQCFENSME